MARIRSVHPSLFTDEGWVSCSPLARLLYIGLWTDADDQGLFEWKPLQIKMRLLPGDAADVPALLAEMVAAGLMAKFDAVGKPYGAIKGFRLYQRPKKPNAIHPLPEQWAAYVGLGSEPAADDGDTVPHQFPTEGEKSPQMEDGGEDEGEGVGSDASASGRRAPADPDPDAEAWALAVHVLTRQANITELQARRFFGKLLKDHHAMPRDLLLPLGHAEDAGTHDPQSYLTAAAQNLRKPRNGYERNRPTDAEFTDRIRDQWSFATPGQGSA